MSTTSKSSILVPHLIAQNAQDDPNGVFARTPSGSSYADGFQDVTKLQFHNAINHTALLLKKTLGQSRDFETLAYIGPADIRYSIIVVAGMKTGYKTFLPSPRNSLEAHSSLLEKLQCTKMVTTEPRAPCVPPILEKMNMQTMTLPSLQQLLEVTNVEEYPYEKTFAEAQNDPAFVMHTSGSTGIPKHLIYTNDFLSRTYKACSLAPPEGYVDISRYFRMGKFFMTLPSFHIAGLAFSLIIPVYYGSVPVYTLPGPPPTTESFISAISNTDIDFAFVPPVILNELSKHPDLLDAVASRLKYIFFTGGSVPKASGDIVAQKLPIWQVLGSSEGGSFPLVHPETGYRNAEDWIYIHFNPLLKAEMRHRLDNLHEFVVVRSEEKEAFQPIFTHFPDTTEFETRDLFTPHPSKQGLWSYHSRRDDVIVFLNGEKTNPISFEEEVIGHPEVRAALVIGAQCLEAALLVELAADASLSEEERIAVVERIWPVVEKANKATPAHARISKSKILLVSPDKPMLRAGKGTVQRNATLALYAEEINKLYQQDEEPEMILADASAHNDTKSLIRSLVADMLNLDNLDFFQLGMDSLGVMKLQRALKSHFRGTDIPLNTVYSNPSVSALAKALEKSSSTNGETIMNGERSTEELEKMLIQFSKVIDTINPVTRPSVSASEAESSKSSILLTGSTGALGSHILHNLLSNPNVGTIYCFNRTPDAQDRQVQNNAVRQLSTDFPPDRITFLYGDLEKPNFGLPETDYQKLLENVTHVIHNAWPVNFNLPLSSFTSSISGVVNLIRFASRSKWNSKIQFFSSISSVSSYTGTDPVPEAIIPDLSTPATMGYGQSKYLAERLLDHASKVVGTKSSIVRIGQISGAARTASGWNRQEWLPSLVASSAFIGALPKTFGVARDEEEEVNWVPIDQLADAVVELALHSTTSHGGQESGVEVFQIVHPKPVLWSSLLEPIKATLQTRSEGDPETLVQVVPYLEWLALLKAKSEGAASVESDDARILAQKNPAMKLIDFYESLLNKENEGLRVKLDMEKTLKVSETLRGLDPIRDEWVVGWVREWITE